MLYARAVTRAVWEVPLSLPRHAFSPRDTARAGELWRLCQQAAVDAASYAGWPPERFREHGTGFVVRTMRAIHHREVSYEHGWGARTWVWDFRRETLTTREVRLSTDQGPVLSATQDWVHVGEDMRPTRASDAVIEAFPPYEQGDETPPLPAVHEELSGQVHEFEFEVWHTWMDPLAHVNHPAYLDWCDEAAARVMAPAGLDPAELVPVAERILFRQGATAGDRIHVRSQRRGVTAEGDVVLAHRILKNDGQSCADATTVRRMATGRTDELVKAFE
jgi:acyl-CoA thioesterase FadM